MVSLPLSFCSSCPVFFRKAFFFFFFGSAPLVRPIVQALSLSSAAALWPTVETPFLAGFYWPGASEAVAGDERGWVLIGVGLVLGL